MYDPEELALLNAHAGEPKAEVLRGLLAIRHLCGRLTQIIVDNYNLFAGDAYAEMRAELVSEARQSAHATHSMAVVLALGNPVKPADPTAEMRCLLQEALLALHTDEKLLKYFGDQWRIRAETVLYSPDEDLAVPEGSAAKPN